MVLANLEHAIEKRNKESASWLYTLRNSKVISFTTLPYVLAFDAVKAIMKKFVLMWIGELDSPLQNPFSIMYHRVITDSPKFLQSS